MGALWQYGKVRSASEFFILLFGAKQEGVSRKPEVGDTKAQIMLLDWWGANLGCRVHSRRCEL